MTIKELLKLDVLDEKFIVTFVEMLEKFNNEYDDMANMEIIRCAKELLDALNNAN